MRELPVFEVGDRIYCRSNGLYGLVDSVMPGNGTMPWYFITFDDGSADRFTAYDLEKM